MFEWALEHFIQSELFLLVILVSTAAHHGGGQGLWLQLSLNGSYTILNSNQLSEASDPAALVLPIPALDAEKWQSLQEAVLRDEEPLSVIRARFAQGVATTLRSQLPTSNG
jgi:hypothetical protein